MKPRRLGAVALITLFAGLALAPIDTAGAVVDKNSIVSTIVDYPDFSVDRIHFGAGAIYETNGSVISRRVIAGATTVVAGGGASNDDGIQATAAKIAVRDFTVLPDGTIYFADGTRHQVRKVDPSGKITTVAGNGTEAVSGDSGPALQAGMAPTSVAVDSTGNLLIADGAGFIFGPPGNHRLRKVTPNGTITTLAVFDLYGGSMNVVPTRVLLDAADNAFVMIVTPVSGVDPQHQIVKVPPNGTKQMIGTENGWNIVDMTVTADGLIYAVDRSNFSGETSTISQGAVQTTLNTTSFIGLFPDHQDGPLSSAFLLPSAITIDPAGNLYALANGSTSTGTEAQQIRKITNANPDPAANPVQPARILDTRPGPEQTGYSGPKPGAGAVVSLQVAGRGGVPATGAAAVTMNVVITEADAAGYVTVWPSGQDRPLASNLNAQAPNDTVANLVTVPIGPDGKVSLFTQTGGHLIADVSGWLPAGAYVPKTPTRLLDTRPGPEQLAYSGDKPGPGSTVDLQITGRAGIPLDAVSAVTLNVTATEATAPGFVTIWPAGQTRPTASSLNLDTVGATAPNQVTVPVGANGKVSLYTQSGAHLIADLVGYYTVSSAFTPVTPGRILDTRPGSEQVGYSGAKPVAGQTVSVVVAGRGGVPATGAGAVILNVTATEATAPGFISAWPGQTDRPNASILNLTYAGQTRPNAVLVPVGSNGTVNLYTQSGTHLVVDVGGWFPNS